MTQEEKAKELYYKIYAWGIRKEGQTLSEKECKELALMAVDEIIDVLVEVEDAIDKKFPNTMGSSITAWHEQVKQEIEKL